MNEYLLLKFAHVVAFVYWLGGDFGTLVASRYVIKRKLSVDARQTALHIMQACDQAPKIAMPIIFALGFNMAVINQFIVTPNWVLGLVWLLTIYWLINVVILYFSQDKSLVNTVSSIDLYFRLLIVITLFTFSIYGLANNVVADNWIIYKVIIFAILVSCGIAIRINLKPFVVAFAKMTTEGASDNTDRVMASSIQRCRPYVWVIWTGLFLNAAFGFHFL